MSEWPEASQNHEVADPFATIPLDASDLEVYQLFASEMFDPSIFENNTYAAVNWDDCTGDYLLLLIPYSESRPD